MKAYQEAVTKSVADLNSKAEKLTSEIQKVKEGNTSSIPQEFIDKQNDLTKAFNNLTRKVRQIDENYRDVHTKDLEKTLNALGDINQRLAQLELDKASRQNNLESPENLSYSPASEKTAPSPKQIEISEPANIKMPEPANIEIPEPANIKMPEPANIEIPEPANIKMPEPANIEIPEPANIKMPEPANIEISEPANIKMPEPANDGIQVFSEESRRKHLKNINDLYRKDLSHYFGKAHYKQRDALNNNKDYNELSQVTFEFTKKVDKLVNADLLSNLVPRRDGDEVIFTLNSEDLIIQTYDPNTNQFNLTINKKIEGVYTAQRFDENGLPLNIFDSFRFKNGNITDIICGYPPPNEKNCRIFTNIISKFKEEKGISKDGELYILNKSPVVNLEVDNYKNYLSKKSEQKSK